MEIQKVKKRMKQKCNSQILKKVTRFFYVEKKTKICVMAIDYAGFTTNMCDLKNLLR